MNRKTILIILLLVIIQIYFLNVKDQALWSYNIDQAFKSPFFLEPSSEFHLLGTDALGRDLLFRIILGFQNTILIAFISLALGGFVGVFLGLLFGLSGPVHWVKRWPFLTKNTFIFFLDTFQSVPQLFLNFIFVLLLQFLFPGLLSAFWFLVFALTITSWMPLARMTFNLTIKMMDKNYIESSLALGATRIQILFRHSLVELKKPIMAYLLFLLPQFFLFESVISFFGFGIKYPETSLGILIQEGWKMMIYYPYLFFVPASFLVLTLFVFKKLADLIANSDKF